MGLFSKDIKTMNDLFTHQLQEIYYAEKQLVKTLPRMAEKATTSCSKTAFDPSRRNQNACRAPRGRKLIIAQLRQNAALARLFFAPGRRAAGML